MATRTAGKKLLILFFIKSEQNRCKAKKKSDAWQRKNENFTHISTTTFVKKAWSKQSLEITILTRC
jgi:hypothetical protein